MRDGCPEQREDPVAEHLVDAATEALDLVDQFDECPIYQAFHPLRVEVLGQRGVADEIGEQDGDDAAFLQ